MRQGGDPESVAHFNKDQHVRKPAQRAVADAASIFDGICLRVFPNSLYRGHKLTEEFAAKTRAISFVIRQRLTQFCICVRVRNDRFHG